MKTKEAGGRFFCFQIHSHKYCMGAAQVWRRHAVCD